MTKNVADRKTSNGQESAVHRNWVHMDKTVADRRWENMTKTVADWRSHLPETLADENGQPPFMTVADGMRSPCLNCR